MFFGEKQGLLPTADGTGVPGGTTVVFFHTKLSRALQRGSPSELPGQEDAARPCTCLVSVFALPIEQAFWFPRCMRTGLPSCTHPSGSLEILHTSQSCKKLRAFAFQITPQSQGSQGPVFVTLPLVTHCRRKEPQKEAAPQSPFAADHLSQPSRSAPCITPRDVEVPPDEQSRNPALAMHCATPVLWNKIWREPQLR